MYRDRQGILTGLFITAVCLLLFLYAAADTARATIRWARGPVEPVAAAPAPPPPAPVRHVPPATPRIIAY